jgi:hypothetical protein
VAFWPPAGIDSKLLKGLEARAGIEPKFAWKTNGLFDSKKDRVQEMQRITGL